MPGIAGIIGRAPSGEASAAVQLMVNSLNGGKSSIRGTYTNEKLGVWLGWVSQEDSFTECLPIWNEKRDLCLIFSGEDFAEQTQIDALRRKGHHWDGDNASYLVHQYEELGPAFFEQLNGWFSGVLIDFRKPSVVLFNDRYGLNRIYYHESSGLLYFSSEAKALLKILPTLRQLNLASLGEFFSCGCVLSNKTLFAGVSLLPGASAWTFGPNGTLSKEAYFEKATWEQQSSLGPSEYYERLKETFERILPRYLRGQKRIGISLTGGLDSRLIMAWARLGESTLPCYTFSGPYRQSRDLQIAQRVAAICKQPHEIIPVDDAFLRDFPTLAQKAVYVSDGAMDVTGAVEIYVNRRAKQIAPIRLTGNYGSEILRGNIAFRPTLPEKSVYESEFSGLIDSAAKTYLEERDGHRLSFIAFKQVPWHHWARFAVEQSQLTVRSPYLDNELVALVYRAPGAPADVTEPSLRLLAEGNPALSRLDSDRVYKQRGVALAQVRSLYQKLTFKAEYTFDSGMPQWLAKVDHLCAPMRLERLFLGRHRFYHFRVWYRDQLSAYVKEVLLDSRTRNRSYLNRAGLERIVTGHLSGRANYTSEIHRLLTSELLQRHLIEQN